MNDKSSLQEKLDAALRKLQQFQDSEAATATQENGESISIHQEVKAKLVTHIVGIAVACRKYHKVRALGK